MRVRDEDGTVYEDGPEMPPNGSSARPDIASLFNAPDFTTLVKPAQSRNAKEYADKVKSMLKSGMIGAINLGDFPDAAAILAHGPGFADAAGQLADHSETAAKAIDIITSPDNPWFTFVMTGIPFIAQLARNHEQAFKDLPESRRQARLRRRAEKDAERTGKPRFTIRLLGRQWPVYFRTPRIGKALAGFKAQTREPYALTNAVFSDPKVIRALQKQGIVLVQQRPEDASTQ